MSGCVPLKADPAFIFSATFFSRNPPHHSPRNYSHKNEWENLHFCFNGPLHWQEREPKHAISISVNQMDEQCVSCAACLCSQLSRLFFSVARDTFYIVFKKNVTLRLLLAPQRGGPDRGHHVHRGHPHQLQDDVRQHQRGGGQPSGQDRHPLLQRLVPHRHGGRHPVRPAHLWLGIR